MGKPKKSKPVDGAVSRSPNDPLVLAIMAAMDRAAASPHHDDVTPNIASSIVSEGQNCEDLDGYSPEACRAIVLAHALHAPDDTCESMAGEAEEQIAWCEWWDRPGGGEHQTRCRGCVECADERAAEQAASVQ